MKFPSPLKQNDVVDIIAPAFGTTEADVMAAVAFLTTWGLQARLPGDLLGKDLLCAHDDATRSRHLQDALTNKESKAVWCLRGGYGSARLTPPVPQPMPPKFFLGFSDITVLHGWLTQHWRWPTLHAPTLLRAAKGETDPASLDLLRRLLFGQLPQLEHPLTPFNDAARQTDRLVAPSAGGNLAVLASLIGTPWQPDLTGKILFLEEVDERGYRIDRLLTQLRQAKALSASAFVLGDFSGGQEADGHSLVWPVLERFFASASIPTYRCPNIGHERTNHPLWLGATTRLTQSTLTQSS